MMKDLIFPPKIEKKPRVFSVITSVQQPVQSSKKKKKAYRFERKKQKLCSQKI